MLSRYRTKAPGSPAERDGFAVSLALTLAVLFLIVAAFHVLTEPAPTPEDERFVADMERRLAALEPDPTSGSTDEKQRLDHACAAAGDSAGRSAGCAGDHPPARMPAHSTRSNKRGEQ